MPLLNPTLNYLLLKSNIIKKPNLSIEVTEMKVPKSEEDFPTSDSYILNILDIYNEDQSKDIDNLIIGAFFDGVIFKIDYNTYFEDKCIVYRPKKVEISNEEFSPIYFKMKKIPDEIKGSNTVVIGCEKLIPGDIISFKIYTDKKGVCNYKCYYDYEGYVAEYRWESYYKTNKGSISGNMKSNIII